ncbi:thiamine phosphate synthase [Actinoplanes sp. NPDC051475]|uniref:thiamine phosphate synthase n=1 Tax=Actinoplanes sp. NPDC051475 TaxID=3157225 RepID=UPI0034511091
MVTPSGVVVLTDRRLAAGPLVEVVRAAVRGGASWIVLREKDLPYGQRSALASELRAVAPVIVAGPDPLGGKAVHLSAVDSRPPGMDLVGRSWHGVEHLSDEDYVTVSPIFPTASKPGYGPALGVAQAAELAGKRRWLALGGVDSAERAYSCVRGGAAGVAVMGAIMRSDDPEKTTRMLVEAVVS